MALHLERHIILSSLRGFLPMIFWYFDIKSATTEPGLDPWHFASKCRKVTEVVGKPWDVGFFGLGFVQSRLN